MCNLIPVLMLVMSMPAISFMPAKITHYEEIKAEVIIKDPNRIYKEYKKTIKYRRKVFRNALPNDPDSVIGYTRKTIKELSAILKSLKELRRSAVVYTAVFEEGMDSCIGVTVIDPDTKWIVSKFGKSITVQQVWGHEIRHQFQYEKGKLSIRRDGHGGILYDITDETDAIKTGMLNTSNIKKIVTFNDDSARKENVDYLKLPEGPLDMDSKGDTLRKWAMRDAAANRSLSEFYKGWEKDYKKSVTPPPHP